MEKSMQISNLFISLFLLMAMACGPKAQVDDLESSRFPIGYRQFSFADKVIDSEVRSITLLTMPVEQDVVGFSYQPDPRDWSIVFSSIPYGDRIPYGIPLELDAFNKTAQVVYTVMVAGDVRNASYERIKTKESEKALILARLEQLLILHPCYTGLRPNHRSCFAHQSELTVETPRIADSCDVLSRWNWMNLTAEEEESLAQNLEDCRNVDGGRLADLDQEIASEDDIRDKAKGIVLDLLNQAERHARSNFVATGATKSEEDTINGYRSLIQMSADRRSFTQFQLAVDFNIGQGYQLYSLENGLIRDFVYSELAPGVWQLTFKLFNDRFWLDAELSMDVNDIYDLRFSGDTDVYFPDGTIRKGVMKIEMDFVR
jgi:hypothetical protein